MRRGGILSVYPLQEVIVELSIKLWVSATLLRVGYVELFNQKAFIKDTKVGRCMVYSLCQWFSNYIIITWRTYQNRLLDPIPRDSNLVDLSGSPKFALLTSSRILLVLLVWGSYLENQWYRRRGMASDKQAEHEIWGQINGDPPWPVQVMLQQIIFKFLLCARQC